jgi:opacity protein-like surface antigen
MVFSFLPAIALGQKTLSINWGIVAGVSSTQLHFKDKPGSTSMAPQLSFDKSTDLTGGVFAEMKFARSKWFSLRNDLTHRRYDASSTDFYNGVGSVRAFGSVTASYLKYSLSARASITKDQAKPFVSFGVSPSLLLSSSNSYLTNYGPTQTSVSLLGKVKSFEFGFFGGAGVQYNRAGAEIRVEQSSGLNPQNCKSKVSTVYILLSYRLLEGN